MLETVASRQPCKMFRKERHFRYIKIQLYSGMNKKGINVAVHLQTTFGWEYDYLDFYQYLCANMMGFFLLRREKDHRPP